jgi:hypothetical protein
MTIDLTDADVERLREVLLRRLNAVHWEMANTENEALREDLRDVRAFLERVLARLTVPVGA